MWGKKHFDGPKYSCCCPLPGELEMTVLLYDWMELWVGRQGYTEPHSWPTLNNHKLELHCCIISGVTRHQSVVEMKPIRSVFNISHLSPDSSSLFHYRSTGFMLFQLIMPTLCSHQVINPNHCVPTCQTIIPDLAYVLLRQSLVLYTCKHTRQRRLMVLTHCVYVKRPVITYTVCVCVLGKKCWGRGWGGIMRSKIWYDQRQTCQK